MKLNLNGYWVSIDIKGNVRNLYKVENSNVYRYENKKWVEAQAIYAELGWNADYDNISEEEALVIMGNRCC